MASFFHITKIDICDRNELHQHTNRVRKQSASVGLVKNGSSYRGSGQNIHSKTFRPVLSEEIVAQQRTNIVANNYVKFKESAQRKTKRRLKKPILFADSYSNREVLQIPCFTFPKLNEHQVIRGRKTLCKFLNKGLVSESVEKLSAVQDVSILKYLLYKNEFYLRRHYRIPKTVLLRNSLDFKSLFYKLETSSSIKVDPIKNHHHHNHDKNTSSNSHRLEEHTTETLRQYYWKRLSARASSKIPITPNKFIETAVRCYIEGFQWHITYLDLCASKSAVLQQKYASNVQQRQQKYRQSLVIKSDMNIEAHTNDILVSEFNQLSINNNNNNSTLPTIVLTDCSENSSDTNNSIIYLTDNSNSESLHEINEQLNIPAIRCHVEARPPSN